MTHTMLCCAGKEGAVVQEPQGAARGDSGRKVSTADIQLVQNLIERCLQVYCQQVVLFCLFTSPSSSACWCAGAAALFLQHTVLTGGLVLLQRIGRSLLVSAVTSE